MTKTTNSRNGSTMPSSLSVVLIVFSGLFMFLGGYVIAKSNLLDSFLPKQINSSTVSGLPRDLDYSSVEQVYDKLRAEYDGELDERKLLDGLKEGLAKASGDPYTVYMTESEAAKFDQSLNGEFSGIGVEIAIKNDQLVVVSPLKGTPADKAGIRTGDKIISIDGKDTVDMTLDEAVAKIRGKQGSEVKLGILRGREAKIVSIKRGNIVVPNATSKIVDGNIGYIELNSFGDDSVSEMKSIATKLKQDRVKGVILDLRNNGGGRLDAAIDIAGLWLDNQPVVSQKSQNNRSENYKSGAKGPLFGVPTVVLVNGGSASASEIVAGALKDDKAAKLVGEKTFGKGSVQVLDEVDGGLLKVTIARWYTPNGVNIDKHGIEPDVAVKLTDADFNSDKDPQLQQAIKLLQ